MGFGLKKIRFEIVALLGENTNLLIVFNHSNLLFTDGAGPHHGLGLASGYGIARLLRLDKKRARTLAIEVGMQNSGLGVALAVKHFSAMAALPGALFSIWHNLSGSLLATIWRRKAINS